MDEESKQKKKHSKIKETIETILIALILALLIRATVAEARYIPSESMLPTLQVGDRLIVEKVSLYFNPPKRGDIIVFYPPKFSTWNRPLYELITNDEEKKNNNFLINTLKWLGLTNEMAYIKRVIGLPGEQIEVKNGQIYINGKVLNEDYIYEKPIYTMPPFKIPNDCLFMMGDNRNNSRDSHVWGPLPIKNVIGHAIIRFWPPNRIGIIH